jgi:hypothetical protein
MKLHLTAIVILAACFPASSALGENAALLDKFRAYEQGKPLNDLIETRQAVFRGTAAEEVRARRERELLAFIASDAHPQARAIAIEWLGCLGSAASVPGLVAARENPDLAAPATAALARIEPAKVAQPAEPPAISPAVAEVAGFHDSLGTGNDDALLISALRSPNELLAGAAIRSIRAGAGSAGLMTRLVSALDQIPTPRQGPLCDALATRPDAVSTLRPVLVARVRSGDPESRAAALLTLGRILLPEDLPLALELTADSGALATAAKAALTRATNPAIDSALIHHANAGDASSVPAIEALAARHAVDAEAALWDLTSSNEAAVSAASYKALGAIITPSRLPAVLDRLAAAQGNPDAEIGSLLWNVVRRHPDPSAAASLLEQRAANAPDKMKQVLLRYATRIRPKPNADSGPALPLPEKDDRPQLIPNQHLEAAYHDCGSSAETRAGNIAIRRSAGGIPINLVEHAHPLATVDFAVKSPMKSPASTPPPTMCSVSARGMRINRAAASRLRVNGSELLPDFAPGRLPSGQAHLHPHPSPAAPRAHLRRRATVTIKSLAGPNAVISELWLLRRKHPRPGASSFSPATTFPPTTGASPARSSPPSCARIRGSR